MMAEAPTTPSKLNILLPTTLAMERSYAPLRDAEILTAASGRLVPMETIVRPIITDGILKIFATLLLPSTKRSAPLIKKKKPKTSKNKFST